MNTNTTRWWRRGVAAAAVGAVVALGAALPAEALPTVPPTFNNGQLHVVKLTGPDTGAPADGTAASAPSLITHPPLQGAVYKIWAVTYNNVAIDLSTNVGWQQAAQLAAGIVGTPLALSDNTYALALDKINNVANFGLVPDVNGFTDTTDSNGEALFQNLTPRLFVVVEAGLPPLATSGSAPFLVTVPITDPTNKDAWLSNVYVYPKNAAASATKTVDDSAALVGKNGSDFQSGSPVAISGKPLTYTVTIPIPDMLTDDNHPDVTSFNFLDDIPTNFATIAPGDVSVTVAGSSLAGSGYTLDLTSNDVHITFLAGGISALNAATALQNVVVTIKATASSAGDPITNSATGTFVDSNALTVNVPSNPIVTKYGLVTLRKWFDADNDTIDDGATEKIVGAQFKLYFNWDNVNNVPLGAAYKDDPSNSGPDAIFQTDTNGQFTTLLRFNAFDHDPNGGQPATPSTYYFEEVKTGIGPNGEQFELLAQPIKIVDGGVGQNFEVDATSESISVQNFKKNAGFVLPLTGGIGTALFYFIGGAIIALTVILIVVFAARRRREHSQH